jgi:hypothetical protein
MALTADLPVGPFGRLPMHPSTPPFPRTNRLLIAALVAGWCAVVIVAVMAVLAA